MDTDKYRDLYRDRLACWEATGGQPTTDWYDDDHFFALCNWTKISGKEAARLNPYLRRVIAEWRFSDPNFILTADTIDDYDYLCFYMCKQYDPEIKGCKLHNTPYKPQICRNYPLYGHTRREIIEYRPDGAFRDYSPICGWAIDADFVGEEDDGRIDLPLPGFVVEDAAFGC
jgi:hypothetical protein